MVCQWSRGLDAGEVLPPALGDEESEAHAGHVTCAAALVRGPLESMQSDIAARACVRMRSHPSG